jgi:uncharacterized membrane protein YhdT
MGTYRKKIRTRLKIRDVSPFAETNDKKIALEDTPLFGTLLKKRDFYAGGLMTLLGAAVTLDSLSYTLGTLTHMGPGMFPLMLGVTLTFIGVLILGAAIVAPLTDDERILPEKPEWFAWACILAGPIAFIILGEFFGLVPATFACVFIPALGDRTATLKGSAVLAAGVTVFGVALFSYVLKIPFPLFRWDF